MNTASCFEDTRLAVRADRDRLLAVLRSVSVPCAVGPSEHDNWVVIRLPAGADPDPVARSATATFDSPVVALRVASDAESLGVRLWRDGEQLVRHNWPEHPLEAGELAADATEAAARCITDALSKAGVEAALAKLLRGDDDLEVDARAESLIALLGLPTRLTDPAPVHVLVLHRGERAVARLAASIAGPAWLVPCERGWTVLIPVEDGAEQAFGLSAGLSSAGSRRAPVLLLWRDHAECGYLLWRRGRPLDVHAWNSPWEVLATDDKHAEELAWPHGNAAVIARVVGRPGAEANLRALLRRRGTPDDLLAELVELLELPEEGRALLDGRATPEHLPHGERLEATSPARAAWVRSRQPLGADAPKALRLVERAWAWGTLAAALVCGAMTALGVAVLATDGAVIGQVGTSAEDWSATLVFAVLTGILGWLGLSRLRRLRQIPRDGGGLRAGSCASQSGPLHSAHWSIRRRRGPADRR
jgi:hypothetical protein